MVHGSLTQSSVFSRTGSPEWGGKEDAPTDWELPLGHCWALFPTEAVVVVLQGHNSSEAYLLQSDKQIDSLPGVRWEGSLLLTWGPRRA